MSLERQIRNKVGWKVGESVQKFRGEKLISDDCNLETIEN